MCFLADSGHFGREFLPNEDENPKSPALSFAQYYKLSNDPTFILLLRKP